MSRNALSMSAPPTLSPVPPAARLPGASGPSRARLAGVLDRDIPSDQVDPDSRPPGELARSGGEAGTDALARRRRERAGRLPRRCAA